MTQTPNPAVETVPSPVSTPQTPPCEWCGSAIPAGRRRHARFCSARCRRRAWAAKQGTLIITGECQGCGEQLTGRRADARWCSERCRMRARKAYPYVWAWCPSRKRTRLGEMPPTERALDRKGERCRVLARGAMNSALIEFEDGYRVVTSRWGLRRVGA